MEVMTLSCLQESLSAAANFDIFFFSKGLGIEGWMAGAVMMLLLLESVSSTWAS